MRSFFGGRSIIYYPTCRVEHLAHREVRPVKVALQVNGLIDGKLTPNISYSRRGAKMGGIVLTICS